jgi:hypothetical protein
MLIIRRIKFANNVVLIPHIYNVKIEINVVMIIYFVLNVLKIIQ